MDLDALLSFHHRLRDNQGVDSDVRLPTFLGVGAARCGTTWLYEYLRQHPDVFMSPAKELNYFGVRSVATRGSDGGYPIEFYRSFFCGWQSQTQAGEISPIYLSQPGACAEIAATLGRSCRIIIMVRDPVERFISHYHHHRMHRPLTDFSSYVREAFTTPFDSVRFDWYAPAKNLRHSLYSGDLCNYFSTFGRANTLVIRYEDLQDGVAVQRRLCSFLHVDFVPLELPVVNTAFVQSDVPVADRERLRRFFRPDIRATARLLEADRVAGLR